VPAITTSRAWIVAIDMLIRKFLDGNAECDQRGKKRKLLAAGRRWREKSRLSPMTALK
jgi:hypothetical protein